jgi:Tol biopolymer transport system component
VGPADDSLLEWPALSPDGRRVAVARRRDGNPDIWVLDGVHQTRLTTDPSSDNGPVWSPDGNWIVFSSNRKGPFNLYRKRSDGVGSDELLLESPFHKNATGWSRDGHLLYSVDNDPKTGYDLWSLLPVDRSTPGNPTVFLNESYEERNAQFSPDGRWVAYVSNESGTHEIYVRPFPGPGAKSPVSTAGGIEPRWRNNGTELYYIAPDSTLMAVPINVKDGTLEAGVPVGLFKPRLVGGGRAYPIIHQYAVAPDGRFLMNVVVGDAPTSPLTVLLNWKPNRD